MTSWWYGFQSHDQVIYLIHNSTVQINRLTQRASSHKLRHSEHNRTSILTFNVQLTSHSDSGTTDDKANQHRVQCKPTTIILRHWHRRPQQLELLQFWSWKDSLRPIARWCHHLQLQGLCWTSKPTSHWYPSIAKTEKGNKQAHYVQCISRVGYLPSTDTAVCLIGDLHSWLDSLKMMKCLHPEA